MALPLTADTFYDGAKEFAHTALEAHHAGKYRRVAIDAGTALEHLAKACLARRSPALLAELRNGNFQSLLRLLGMGEDRPSQPVRTVGLREALERAKSFVKSAASAGDLRTLVDMRDGSVHGAENEEVEDRLLVAFVQQGDAFLEDLSIPREVFWGAQLPVVNALLADAKDKIAHRVEVKLAEARASFERQYSGKSAELLDVVRRLGTPKQSDPFEPEESLACPACGSSGVASGVYDIEWDKERDEDGLPVRDGRLQFLADDFDCRVCGLRLRSQAELTAAGVKTALDLGQVDRNDYWSFFEDPDEG